ncbi:hypothetical protein B0A78_06770, partial [Flavobacterium columnare NBRC 100251 = ATCC 23463]|uniref:hypothetical protein n=1 Tax=Flavobacterium columnare TaxID=996 RepID=UPI000BEE4C63
FHYIGWVNKRVILEFHKEHLKRVLFDFLKFGFKKIKKNKFSFNLENLIKCNDLIALILGRKNN